MSRLGIALALALGGLGGIGGYTFRYGEGLSYFSTDPAACANCHIMQPQYDAWQKSSHHISASCVDCHLPIAFVAKYLAKAENGWYHSKGFTLQDFAEPIQIKPGNIDILEANCRRCHAELIGELAVDAIACTRCHASVGHGDRAGLGPRLRPEELRTELHHD